MTAYELGRCADPTEQLFYNLAFQVDWKTSSVLHGQDPFSHSYGTRFLQATLTHFVQLEGCSPFNISPNTGIRKLQDVAGLMR